jgi:hypothetical protein
MVTVSTEDAIRFVQDLGDREAAAHPVERDKNLLDPILGHRPEVLVGPSEEWWGG